MKGKKLTYISVGLASILSLGALAACGGGGQGDNLGSKEIGDRTKISFYCDANDTSEQAWLDLITAYNDGVGYEKDNVYVTAKMQQNASSPSANYFTKSGRYAYNVMSMNDSQNSFQTLAIKRDDKKAPDGYFLDLTEYAANDADFQKNTISESTLNWWRMTYNKSAKQGAGKEKHVVGAGQKLLGVPYGTNAHFNWYNRSLFEAQGINLISVPEEELDAYNTEHGSHIMPHGYAEYKEAPFTGAKSSTTLDGRTVYKVFNDCIGMNWEEQRYLLKYFTKDYNSKSTSTYGFCSEYWFNYGWSVGGDVMGFDGTSYDFTLMDRSANYIVTKNDTTVGDSVYKAGEIVRYEDKKKQAGIESMDGVYAIESTYNAVKEYLSMNIANDKTVDVVGDTTYKGYGVATPETGSADNYFNTQQIAMTQGTPEGILNKRGNASADICMPQTYREYEGGSTYQKDGVAGFENEYLKVIGETYDSKTYTGELKVVNGTKIIGNSTSASISQGLVIPACSDPEKYQAAWDFISWVATEGQKYIAYTNTLAPVAADTLFGADYAKNESITHGKNFYAVAKTASNAGRGDWGYFENGEWVTAWANDFNGNVRRGNKTMSAFVTDNGAAAKKALDNMYCVIKGIR